MYERKQHVIKKAHQLFIEKGFQATSIQDILDFSGISKGTFYNYFPSKSELLKAVFTSIRNKYVEEQNELLIGENRADLEIFIKQLNLFFQSNKQNKLFTLIEEVFVTNDLELKQFVKGIQLLHVRWLYHRFIDLFGEEKQLYLLDCAILFTGMLQQTYQYNLQAYGPNVDQNQIIRYCVERLKSIVEEVYSSKSQLLKPTLLYTWIPEQKNEKENLRNQFYHLSESVKKIIMKIHQNEPEKIKYEQLVVFIQEEIMNNKNPRLFLIESALLSLRMCPELQKTEELLKLENHLTEYVLDDDMRNK